MPPMTWTRPAPFSGTPESLAEHVEAIAAMMAGSARMWLAAFPPPERLADTFDDAVLVVPTSGSTGTAKAVALTRGALVASHDATARLLSGSVDGSAPERRRPARAPGHGCWLPLLPPTHIAGIQVIARACRAADLLGRPRPLLPAELPALAERFDARTFSRAAAGILQEAEHEGLPVHTSLVPTQLLRILDDATDAGVRARALLGRFDTVLVGGAAIDPATLVRARERGLRVRTTYGASETAGGCVYDGRPLDGVRLTVRDDTDDVAGGGEGRLVVSSPTLAIGYVRPDGSADLEAFPRTRPPGSAASPRVYVTSDLARLRGGTLRILGRADDVVVTGGLKVLPQDVERAIHGDEVLGAQVTESVVVGVPDAQWGERLVALVVPSGDADVSLLPALLRATLRAGALPHHAVPKATLVVEALPRLGIGKIDRSAARREAIARGA